MYIQTYYILLGEDVSEIIKKNSQEFASWCQTKCVDKAAEKKERTEIEEVSEIC